MKNEITFHVRAFPVTVYDKRSDITEEIIVPITKQHSGNADCGAKQQGTYCPYVWASGL